MYAIPICVSSWWKLFLHCQIQNHRNNNSADSIKVKRRHTFFVAIHFFGKKHLKFRVYSFLPYVFFLQTMNHSFSTEKNPHFRYPTHGKVNPISLPNRLSYSVCALRTDTIKMPDERTSCRGMRYAHRPWLLLWMVVVCLFVLFFKSWLHVKGLLF